MAGGYRYLSLDLVLVVHGQVMQRLGDNPEPLRDRGALESAVYRPQHAAHYEHADLIRQAALLAVGISQNQPFVNGNKRTAFAACDLFLRMNGHAFAGDPLELAKRLETVAEHAGRLDEATDAFERWLRGNIRNE